MFILSASSDTPSQGFSSRSIQASPVCLQDTLSSRPIQDTHSLRPIQGKDTRSLQGHADLKDCISLEHATNNFKTIWSAQSRVIFGLSSFHLSKWSVQAFTNHLSQEYSRISWFHCQTGRHSPIRTTKRLQKVVPGSKTEISEWARSSPSCQETNQPRSKQSVDPTSRTQAATRPSRTWKPKYSNTTDRRT